MEHTDRKWSWALARGAGCGNPGERRKSSGKSNPRPAPLSGKKRISVLGFYCLFPFCPCLFTGNKWSELHFFPKTTQNNNNNKTKWVKIYSKCRVERNRTNQRSPGTPGRAWAGVVALSTRLRPERHSAESRRVWPPSQSTGKDSVSSQVSHFCVCVKSLRSCLTVTPWPADHRVSLSKGFSRQEHWSVFPTQGSNVHPLCLLY